MKRYSRAILMVILAGFSAGMFAQQQEEVRVVKPYTPTLSGAEKIRLLPEIGDTVAFETPEFEYSIFSKRFETGYRVTPIQPARMVKQPLDRLYKSELTLGGGNYLTPLAELRINQLRKSKGMFGFGFRHHSMNGEVKRENDRKSDAGFNENHLSFYGKRFFNTTTLDYRAGARYNGYMHYGVDTTFIDTLNRDAFFNEYYEGYAGIGFQSARADSFHLNFNGNLDYYFFSHGWEQNEHGAKLDFNLDQIVSSFRLGGDIGLEYYGHQESWDTVQTNQFLVKFNPYITKSTADWSFLAGLNTYTEITNGVATPKFYVRGKFSFNIVKEVLVPYFGIDGYRKVNPYKSLIGENNYITPELTVRATNYPLVAYGGLKGKITDYLAWNLQASYSVVEDQYFFVTDTVNGLNNQFNVTYDDMTVFNVSGEFNIAPRADLRLLLKGNYYTYTLDLPHAWYKQNFDISLQARYNLGDKILANAGLFVVGPRYYQHPDPSVTEPGKLNTTIDLNLGAEYRYTKLLSFWLRMDNIAAQPYYQWYNYPGFRFRFMAGFTYGL